MTKLGQIRVGTSGWHYAHWRGPFYPAELSSRQWLAYYASRLASVEVNSSFYRLPSLPSLEGWRQATPRAFTFAIKGSRFITHLKKLKDASRHLPLLLERVALLGPKLGPVLFQLPPGWDQDLGRLEAFLAALPGSPRFAMEFRDDHWWNEQTYDLLRRHGAAFCLFDLDGRMPPRVLTGDFVYLRLHGPQGAYQGRYSAEFLAGLAQDMLAWAGQGLDVYCYLDNDQAGYAVQNALELQALLAGGRTA